MIIFLSLFFFSFFNIVKYYIFNFLAIENNIFIYLGL